MAILKPGVYRERPVGTHWGEKNCSIQWGEWEEIGESEHCSILVAGHKDE